MRAQHPDDTQKRIDGRDLKTVRPIVCEVGILPRTHGSALFTRGETQALVVATLGTGEDEQYVDSLEGTYKEHFLLHYNFPPYSVGEVGRMGGRRAAARSATASSPGARSIRCCPTARASPTPSASSRRSPSRTARPPWRPSAAPRWRMMDAGIPLKRPVAGIAMGLIKEGERFAVLSDILGDEDHLGDMDFKVAGTSEGRHLAADGHQDHRHHRGDHEDGARPGARRPPAYPGRDGQGAERGARRILASMRRASRRSTSRPTRSAK